MLEQHVVNEAEIAALVRQLSRRSSTTSTSDLTQWQSYTSESQYNDNALSLDHFSLANYLREVMGRAKLEGKRVNRHAGVVFKNLTVTGASGAEVRYALNVPAAFMLPYTMVRDLIRRKPPGKVVIKDFTGVVREGEMLLVLGRPGSGCSTLLKSLAGEHNGYSAVDGVVHYNGISQKDMIKRFRGEVLYNPEVDQHFPHLTVSQTLMFAATCRAPRLRLKDESRADFVLHVRDILAKVLGLTHTFHTKVGDDFVRGVSGGERKRVSIAEMLSTRSVVQCWDNSTRGLDSSTALEFVESMRVSTNLLRSCAVVAIYQAGEKIYESFDRVTILYDGQQVFFGPVEKARAYFEHMGFMPQSRQTTADFLTAVTDPKGRFPRQGMENKVPRTAEEFAMHWKKSPAYLECVAEVENYEKESAANNTRNDFEDAAQREKARHVSKSTPYMISYPMQVKACVRRAYQRLWGDKSFLIANVVGSVFQSLIVGSVFYNISDSTSGYFSRGGVIFFAILFNALSAMSEIVTAYAQRPIVERHKAYALYHPSAEALSQVVADLPIRFVNIAIFDIIIYFMTNLYPTAGQFFIFFLFTYVVTLTMVAFFRMLAALTKDISQAQVFAGLGVLALAIYTGYVIPRPTMHVYFKWISYINPISFGFEALMANEFLYRDGECSTLVPSYPNANITNQVCTVEGSVTGQLTVSGPAYLSASFAYEFSNVWRNLGIVLAFWIFFVAVTAVAVEYAKPPTEGAEVLLFKRGAPSKAVQNAIEAANSAKPETPESGASSATVADIGPTASRMEIKSRSVFAWQHVDYTIPIKKGTRQLLNDVQGYVKPGTMTALMGESGAGKTTLLNVLAQRVNMGVITGEMLVNGEPIDHSFQRKTGYVQQQDVHVGEMTVREALQFSALLRRSKSLSRQEKYDYVEQVIELLEMTDYAEAIIGIPGVGLNVEQRKRLTVGM